MYCQWSHDSDTANEVVVNIFIYLAERIFSFSPRPLILHHQGYRIGVDSSLVEFFRQSCLYTKKKKYHNKNILFDANFRHRD